MLVLEVRGEVEKVPALQEMGILVLVVVTVGLVIRLKPLHMFRLQEVVQEGLGLQVEVVLVAVVESVFGQALPVGVVVLAEPGTLVEMQHGMAVVVAVVGRPLSLLKMVVRVEDQMPSPRWVTQQAVAETQMELLGQLGVNT